MGFVSLWGSVLWVAATATPVETTVAVRLVTPPATRGSARLLHDGFAAAITLSHAPSNLEEQLRGHKWVRAQVISGDDGGDALVYVRVDDAKGNPAQLTDARLGRTAAGLELQLVAQGRVQSAMSRVLRYVPPLEAAGSDSAQLRAAEGLLVKRSLPEAAAAFEELRDNYALRPWAELRLADVTLLRRDAAAGCVEYRKVVDHFGDRTVGLVARLRMAVLGCLSERRDNLDWVSLLRRVHADDAASRWQADEARWAILWSDDRVLIDSLTSYGVPLLGAPLFEALLQRLLESGDPLEVLSSGKDYDRFIGAQSQGGDMRIWQVLALCSLDLPRQALREASVFAAQVPAMRASLIAAARCVVDAPPGTGASASHEVDQMAQRLQALERRVAALRAAVAAGEKKP